MEYCEGFKNWLKCLRCADICTSRCPLEKESQREAGIWRSKENDVDLKSMER